MAVPTGAEVAGKVSVTFYRYVGDVNGEVDVFGLAKNPCGSRITKHTDNRHVIRSKYPGKSKFRKPANLKKNTNKTLKSPDAQISQRGNRVRYERDHNRVIGTDGETVQVVVVDTKLNKIITTFPTRDLTIL